MKRKISIACLLIASLVLASCTQQDIQLAEALVNLGAPLIALIPGQTGADAQAIEAYAGPALDITDALLGNYTPAGAAAALTQFNALILPKLTANASPQTQQALANFADGLQKLIAGLTVANVPVSALPAFTTRALVNPATGKPLKPLSVKDQKRIEALRAKIKALKAKLKN